MPQALGADSGVTGDYAGADRKLSPSSGSRAEVWQTAIVNDGTNNTAPGLRAGPSVSRCRWLHRTLPAFQAFSRVS